MASFNDMKDLRCINYRCPQCVDDKCGAPDEEVCYGNEDKGLLPCGDRKV